MSGCRRGTAHSRTTSLPPGRSTPGELAQGGVEVGHVAQAEGDRGAREAAVGEGEGQGVGGEGAGARRGRAGELVARDGEHRHAEVGRRHPRPAAAQGQRLVAGAAAEVEHLGAGRQVEDRGGALAPDHVEVGREQVVQQVVAGRHPREHVLDGASRLVETGLVENSGVSGMGTVYSSPSSG